MGLFNFWRKNDAQPAVEEQAKSASATSEKGKASKPAKKSASKKTKKADPGPDPLQLAVDKIATRPQ